ncbi:MAG: hypothetical protein AAFX80_02015 [Cyanobacteria bacterium J06639_18]
MALKQDLSVGTELITQRHFIGIADYRYDFAPQPPIMGEKDNLKSPIA